MVMGLGTIFGGAPRLHNPARRARAINMRNALIAKYNARSAIERARDKVAAKVALEAAGIACTGTVAVIDDHQKLGECKPLRDMPDAWAIKPARGSQGDGSCWRCGAKGTPVQWIGRSPDRGRGDAPHPEGRRWRLFRRSAAEDAALIEPLIIADPALAGIVPEGLPDLRVISLHHTPLMAMVRLPTNESDGKANSTSAQSARGST